MTVADLKHFFERPYPTVRLWIKEGRLPRGPAGIAAAQLLKRLVSAVQTGFVVPTELSSRARPTYMKKLRHDCQRGKLSQPRSPRRGV